MRFRLFSMSSLVAVSMCLALAASTWSQEAADTSTAQSAPGSDEFERIFQEWKGLLGQLRELREAYASAEEEALEGIQTEYITIVDKAEKMAPQLRDAAVAAYQQSPNEDRAISRLLVSMIRDDVRRDDYEPAAKLATLLVENDCDERALSNWAGIASRMSRTVSSDAQTS